MLELLVVQWYYQWETLSKQKEGGKMLLRNVRHVYPPHILIQKAKSLSNSSVKITSDNAYKNKFISVRHR